MLDQGQAQKAILDTLESKVKKLRKEDALKDKGTFFLAFEELEEKHLSIFRLATVDELIMALSMVELKTGGRFKLPGSAEMEEARKKMLKVVENNPKTIHNLFWRIRYSDNPRPPERPSGPFEIFWLTSKGPLGFLFRPTDKDTRLELDTNTVAYRLLSFFAAHAGFTDTKYIAEKLETSRGNLAREVAKLRSKVGKKFGVDGKTFIVGRHGPGYALGDTVRIEEK